MLETLQDFGTQIKSVTMGFESMRDRLEQVETTMSLSMRNLQQDYEVRNMMVSMVMIMF